MIRRNRLKEFYAANTPDQSSSSSNNKPQPPSEQQVLDINGTEFQTDKYLQKLLAEQSLCSLLRIQCEFTAGTITCSNIFNNNIKYITQMLNHWMET